MNNRQKLKAILYPQGLINILEDLLKLVEDATISPSHDFPDPIHFIDDYLT